jgi:hypothetical protein
MLIVLVIQWHACMPACLVLQAPQVVGVICCSHSSCLLLDTADVMLPQVPYRLVLLAAADVPADSRLVAAAAAHAHVLAHVSPLEGRTAALDGSLTVLVRRACRAVAHAAPALQQQQQVLGRPAWLCPGSSSVWFFRAGDVGVRWLPEVHGKELVV